MRSVLVSATVLAVVTASATAEASPLSPTLQANITGEGGDGWDSVKVAGAAASTLLFVPDADESLLVAVGEGGEGGRGRGWRGHRGPSAHYYPQRRYRAGPGYYRPRYGAYSGPYYGRGYYGQGYYGRRHYGRPRIRIDLY